MLYIDVLYWYWADTCSAQHRIISDAQSATHEAFGVESVQAVRERARGVIDELEDALPSGSRWMVVVRVTVSDADELSEEATKANSRSN